MGDERLYYRRRLPHYQPPHATFFTTFRLAGSLPDEVILDLKREHQLHEKRILELYEHDERRTHLEKVRLAYFDKFSRLLGQSTTGPQWLGNPQIAGLVADAIRYRDGRVYDLLAYCVMPNHVHAVFTVERSDASLYRILQSLKAYTAVKANDILHRSGAFWQHESYDHVVRKGEELERLILYVLNNPVEAGLVNVWTDWNWSYCKYKLKDGELIIPPNCRPSSPVA